MFDIKEQLKLLPDKPGVYLMKNKANEIIYVGKAISLKNRVRQYFQSSNNQHPKVRAMVTHINFFEYIVTDSELEALILECNLIKENRPKYNVLLRDDKTYPYIKVTMNETFPRVLKTRKVLKDKAKYFGPYTNISALNETLEVIHQMYPIRVCGKNIEKMIERQERPCLNYHIRKCIGPCTGMVNDETYQQMIHEIILFLGGKEDELIKKIEEKMKRAAEKMDFEGAAHYRDQRQALLDIIERQKVVSVNDIDQDIIAMAKGEQESCVQVFFVRGGKLVQREHYILTTREDEDEKEILSAFIKQFYGETNFIPKEVLVEREVEDQELMAQWLTNKRGNHVKVRAPLRGEKKSMIQLVKRNAALTMGQREETQRKSKEKTEGAMVVLQEALGLADAIHRVEAFDISNTQGMESVGSMVVFEGGKPKNKDYRRFKIKTIQGANDYGSIEEIIYRRYKRGVDETKAMIENTMTVQEGKFSLFPDLIMVDGGLGQVTSVKKGLAALGILIPVCGMVKDERHRTRGLVYEGKEIPIERPSHLLRFITQVQDEVHRFAITYHRSLRTKSILHSVLEDIPGIGEKRRKSLMKHFESIDKMKQATIEELIEVEGLNRKVAENMYHFFRKQ
ncbi:excinuclease ABC, C subunit [Alkaliphilus metalliredigens QYMF]|uniref:UvrABC system protein C n=1 Tax=Alkaliphilus metalliredigens (strain QYMF) TaxID=293826 RepID=UVRC_ALKMQ|nr:excinuclease ABC subunit UvrC [Alkaliphilus metalliredigens]A6TVI7.1 RecName: Full=UvrABC system protein C; Short=Protein UvrC; AltName: Full=Excinuclease ABC subunit C [Alkaliphilus metalliredigens QYMF]ABR50205.1 excinuclease ABC, C subunit [Alkaliphilus metalliredigens QYMF]